MKGRAKMKKLLISLLCVISVVSLMASAAFSVSAETIKFDFTLTQPGWGTEADGIIARFANSYPGYHTPWSEPGGHPNLDFEKGLMYWSTTEKTLKPSDYVDIVAEESGNHYLTFTAEDTYDGIESVPFVESRIDENDEVCVVFKWKGDDPNFQVYVNQLRYKTTDGTSKDSHRVSHNGDAKRNEIISDGEDGWNVAFCKPENDSIKKPHDIMPYYIFQVGVQVQNDPSCTAIVDDIRLGKYNATNDCIYDLDGKVMYDLRNLKTTEGEDILNAGMFPNIDYDVEYADVYSDKAQDDAAEENGNEKKSYGIFKNADGSFSIVFWVVVICVPVVLIALAALVVVIIIKKKKAPKANEVSDDEAPETIEESQETQGE